MLAVGSAVLYSSTADWPSFILDSFSVFITCNDWHTFFFIFVRASTKIGHCLLWAFERPAVSCSYVEIWHGTEQGKCSFSSHNVFYFVRNDTSIRVDLIFIPLWKKKQTNKQMIANGYRVVSSEFLAKFPFLIQRLFFLFLESRTSGGLQCGPPPAPLNAKMVLGGSDQIGDDPNQLHGTSASVTYVCDPGFELIG